MSIYSRLHRCRTLDKDKNPVDPSKIVQDSPLLKLPRELRDEVLKYLLEARKEPPPYPPTTGRRQKLHDTHDALFAPFRYPPWVWVCRQLRSECFELIAGRVAGAPLMAELDIMFKGYLSWPTWTYLPPKLPRETPFDLEVTMRIFSTEAFRFNDGWPRQPGTAFRDLLFMLNNLLHNGPSLKSSRENGGLYRINKLLVNVSFNDDYTPDTFPETAHNIFKMLKQLATVGLTSNIVRTVQAHTEYDHQGKKLVFDGEWDVLEQVEVVKTQQWNSMGFFCPSQIYSRSRYPTVHSS